MIDLVDLVWIVPFFPLVAAVVNGVASSGFGLSRRVVDAVALTGSGLAFLVGWAALLQGSLAADPPMARVVEVLHWVAGGDVVVADGARVRFDIAASFQIDALSMVMVGVISLVGFLVHVYSLGVLVDEPDHRRARFFGILSLLVAAGLVVVLSANLPTLYLGWEGVGLCTVLLVGVVGGRDGCAPAGARVFIVGRIGAAAFLLAMVFAFFYFGTVELEGLRAAAATGLEHGLGVPATVISFLLLVGAAGMSAQLPFLVWLQGAASAPAPASALIQSVAMVAAGVFVLVRYGFLVVMSPSAMLAVAVLGGTTAVFAAAVSIVHHDIGEVLSHATVSQLGLVLLGIGVGAARAATFHLIVQALAMAGLVLGSGLVLRAVEGRRDVFEMGGLRKIMPVTYRSFVAAASVIAAVPPLSAFLTRDAVLNRTFEAGLVDFNSSGGVYFLLWGFALASTALMAAALFRLVFLVFFGDFRGDGSLKARAAKAPLAATAPPVILAVLSVAATALVGFSGRTLAIGRWVPADQLTEPTVGGIGAGVGWGLSALTAVVVLASIVVAVRFYVHDAGFVRAEALARRFPTTRKLLVRECWIDTLFDFVVGRGVILLAMVSSGIDRRLVDGVVNGVRHTTVGVSWLSGIVDLRGLNSLNNRAGDAVEIASVAVRRLQLGVVQGAIMVMVFGAALLLGIVFVMNL